MLNDTQQYAYKQIVDERRNVFLTGPGGCGKSFLIREICKTVSSQLNIGITSLTAVSALMLGGKTLHSFLGIKLGLETVDKLYSRVIHQKTILRRWRKLDMLIIDEVSMLSPSLLDKLEELARLLRENDLPFGGIQLVFSGDFLQLPVVNADEFCFESLAWNQCVERVIVFDKVVRQTDQVFIRVLNKIRLGVIDDECRQVIGSRVLPLPNRDGILPTMLYSTNRQVDCMNHKCYRRLEGEEYVFKTTYDWKQQVYSKEAYTALAKFPAELKLKVGAQVMYLYNEPDGTLVNGSRGVVKGFRRVALDKQLYPIVQFTNNIVRIVQEHTIDIEEDENVVMAYSQLPLRLAWSSTCHKLQGATVSLLHIDFDNFFECGQFYVALSRCSSLDGLYISNLDWNRLKTNKKAIDYYTNLIDNTTNINAKYFTNSMAISTASNPKTN